MSPEKHRHSSRPRTQRTRAFVQRHAMSGPAEGDETRQTFYCYSEQDSLSAFLVKEKASDSWKTESNYIYELTVLVLLARSLAALCKHDTFSRCS